MRVELTMKAVIDEVVNCKGQFTIAATHIRPKDKQRQPRDVQIITLSEGVIFSKKQDRTSILSGDIVEIDYFQDLEAKKTKISNLHGRFLESANDTPYARFLLLKTHTPKIQFPTAFVFPASQ